MIDGAVIKNILKDVKLSEINKLSDRGKQLADLIVTKEGKALLYLPPLFGKARLRIHFKSLLIVINC